MQRSVKEFIHVFVISSPRLSCFRQRDNGLARPISSFILKLSRNTNNVFTKVKAPASRTGTPDVRSPRLLRRNSLSSDSAAAAGPTRSLLVVAPRSQRAVSEPYLKMLAMIAACSSRRAFYLKIEGRAEQK